MKEESILSGIRMTLDLLQDCAKEAAAATAQETLSERVMGLFRSEDLDGIATLMKQCKLEQEFVDELSSFIEKWTMRTQAEQ